MRLLVPFVVLLFADSAQADGRVEMRRVPEGGIQPRVAVGSDGTIHLVYFKGEPGAGDILYVRSRDGAQSFSEPLRVNSQEGSAVAIGTIRGAQIALGKGERLHVAWNGSGRAKTPHGAPMLYSRFDPREGVFEPQRNVMTRTRALDGGGSVAADRDGNVYVVWHASEVGGPEGEGGRAVWIARSKDDGKTFSGEIRANTKATGACGCCGLSAFADKEGTVFALYRTATNVLTRDMHLLASSDGGGRFLSGKVDSWSVPTCVMSMSSFYETSRGVLAAWETKEDVYFGLVDEKTATVFRPVKATGQGNRRKHPVLTANSRGEVLLAWTEGTAWKRGGSLAWQLYDKEGRPVAAETGKVPGVPVWGFAAVVPAEDGSFVVLY